MRNSQPNTSPWKWLAISIGCIFIDQITKHWAMSYLPTREEVSVLPGVIFYLCYNPGIGFGLFSDQNMSFIFVILATFMLTDVAYRLFHHNKIPDWLIHLSLSLILGGGISNLYDRYHLSVVVDFIGLHLFKYKGPVFNLADIFISTGFMLIIVSEIMAATNHNKVSS